MKKRKRSEADCLKQTQEQTKAKQPKATKKISPLFVKVKASNYANFNTTKGKFQKGMNGTGEMVWTSGLYSTLTLL